MKLTKHQFDEIFEKQRQKSYDDFSERIIEISTNLKSENQNNLENLLPDLIVALRTSIDKMYYSVLSELIIFSEDE